MVELKESRLTKIIVLIIVGLLVVLVPILFWQGVFGNGKLSREWLCLTFACGVLVTGLIAMYLSTGVIKSGRYFKLAISGYLMVCVVLFMQGLLNWSALKPLKQPALVPTATFFVHGMPSSYVSELQMTQFLVDAGMTPPADVIVANVKPNGKVILSHRLPKNPVNPIIEVNFKNNREKSIKKMAFWIRDAVEAVQREYPVRRINFVGHSAGPVPILYYVMMTRHNQTLPRVNRIISLGGSINGALTPFNSTQTASVTGDGYPVGNLTKDYLALQPLHNCFPRYIKVDNIYGNLNDENDSDGRVTNASSQSMRYLVKSRAKSYKEIKLVGPDVCHSGLHNSKRVDFYLLRLLTGKSC